MVGSKENYKFDVGVKGLIIYLLGIIVSCLHMFRILSYCFLALLEQLMSESDVP